MGNERGFSPLEGNDPSTTRKGIARAVLTAYNPLVGEEGMVARPTMNEDVSFDLVIRAFSGLQHCRA
ncbi:MAG TPA: hypothetical protein DGO89_23425 [Microcoleaceae bacterium UBA9251]|nr:hypothetical protein [Microcoleaceae cyanobacterium UBA9251]